MARLPTVVEGLQAPRGEPVSTAVVAPTDFGLGAAAQAVKAVAEAKDAADDRTAQHILQTADMAFQPKFAERAAAYDGRSPGFARQQLAAFDDHFTQVAEDGSLSPGVRSAIQTRVANLRTSVGSQALAVEGQKRAGIVADQEKVKRDVRIGQQVIAYNGRFSAAYQARVDAFDGSDPDFAKGAVDDHDQAAAATLEAAPEDIRTDVQAMLNAKKVQIAAQALETQDHGHDAYVIDHAQQSVAALTNNVLANPAAYDSTVGDIAHAAAGVPGKLRAKFTEEAGAALAQARIKGLVDKGDLTQAHAELTDHRFDKILKPAQAEALLAHVDAAQRGGPKSLEDWRRVYEADANIDAEAAARARGETTGYTLQGASDVLSARMHAEAERKWQQADQVFAATGNLKAQTNDELRSRAIAPSPALNDPQYGEKFKAWELSRRAAAGELEARQKDPAAWAMNSTRPDDTGAAVQARWKSFTEAKTAQEMGQAGQGYATLQLGVQARAGVPPAAMRIFTADQAGQLAQSFVKAPPEKRAEALHNLALTVAALPSAVRMPDGSLASPVHMAVMELHKAGLGTADLSALTDLRDDPGKLGLYADAVSNPAAVHNLTAKGAETALAAQVDGRLAPFLATANALPGSAELNFGRRDRVLAVARHLMLTQGLAPAAAAQRAASDLTDSYRFADGWRMPAAQAAQHAGFLSSKFDLVRQGLARTLDDLTGTDGKMLAPAPGPDAVTLADRQKVSADRLRHTGRWVTQEDDKGVQLMVPDTRGWTPMADKYGRPIRLTWDQAAHLMQGDQLHRQPFEWMAPPPNHAAPATVPAPRAKAAFAAAIEGRESRGVAGAVSPKGALGVRQLMPKTAEAAAKALGVAYEPARLLTDPAYNRKLSDKVLDDLATKYHGNPALIAAGYNAGPGAVDDWIRRFGDPRTAGHSVDDWVAHIPYPETRAYVRNVLPRAVSMLGEGQ